MLKLTNHLLQKRGGNLSRWERSRSQLFSPYPAPPRLLLASTSAGIQLQVKPRGWESVSLGLDVGLPHVAAPRPVAAHSSGLEVTPASAGLWISSAAASSKLFHE